MNQHYQEPSESAHAVTAAPATATPADEAADSEVRDRPGISEDAGHHGEAGEQPTATVPSTGDDRVDQALARLAELDRLDVTEHAGVVEDVHRALQDTLAEDED